MFRHLVHVVIFNFSLSWDLKTLRPSFLSDFLLLFHRYLDGRGKRGRHTFGSELSSAERLSMEGQFVSAPQSMRQSRQRGHYLPQDRPNHRETLHIPGVYSPSMRRASDGMPNLQAFKAHLERVAGEGSSGSQKSSLKRLHKEHMQLQKQFSNQPLDARGQELQQRQHQLHQQVSLYTSFFHF